ncbi:MAG: hypothetical protein KJ749_12015 [Planctomycetes bacterium]|nr:hypothetical protein [Planctomycetota bacterium]
MKTERRHELKESDLAHAIDNAKTYLAEHGSRLLLVGVLVVVALLAVMITAQARTTALQDAWQRKNELNFDNVDEGRESLTTLAAIIRDVSDPAFKLASLIDQGRYALSLAQKVDDPPDAELNEVAREAFNALLARAEDSPLAFAVAHTGLATVEENAFTLDGNRAHRDNAAQHLQAVVDYPAMQSMPFHRLAAERLASIDEVFSIVRFDTAIPEEEKAAAADVTPTPIGATRVPQDQVPQRILQKVRATEDGRFVPVEDDEDADQESD